MSREGGAADGERVAPRIAVLGNPTAPGVAWDDADLEFLASHGFDTVQLNIAWSWRPGDEPLNLEDIVSTGDEPLPHGADPSPEAWERRRRDLAERGATAHRNGLRTVFHCGVPYNARDGYHDAELEQCILDPETMVRYETLLRRLAREFPDVDDVLVYTYDQEAWLCSEFGHCRRCRGVPLHERVAPFLNRLGAAWRGARAGGRLWWEPWELSAGQVLATLPLLDPLTLGVAMHSSAAEVVSTNAVDALVRNAAATAHRHGLPLVVELFLTGATEETEPYQHVPVPLVTLRQLRAVAALPGPVGIKEYYGIVPHVPDPNLDAAAEYAARPEATDEEIVAKVAATFGSPDRLAAAWARASEAYATVPWDASWFIRQLGRSVPAHALTAATVRGMQSAADRWNTPSWRSTRGTGFMRTDNTEPHPWLLEDVQLRCAAAADTFDAAIATMTEAAEDVDGARQAIVAAGIAELAAITVRLRAYELHLRATNLAGHLRALRGQPGVDVSELVTELRDVLARDLENQRRAVRVDAAVPDPELPARANRELLVAQGWLPAGRYGTDEIEQAIGVLDTDLDAFLDRYLRVPEVDAAPRGQFSLTSR